MAREISTAATDAAAETEDNLVVAQLFAEGLDSGFDVCVGAPVAFRATDAVYEVAQQACATGRVEYLGMELHAPLLFTFNVVGGAGDVLGGGYDLE